MAKFIGIDFFCGGGGATRGMIDAGGYVAAGVDIDGGVGPTYRLNNRNAALDRKLPAFINKSVDDVKHVGERIAAAISGLRELELPLMFAACAPCQPFANVHNISAARRAERLAEADLLIRTLPYITRFLPDVVISENIPAAATDSGGKIWQRFEAELGLLGYRVSSKKICVSNFGVPQRRRRVILIAVKSAIAIPLDVPSEDAAAPRLSAREAIGHLPPLAAGESSAEVANHQCQNLGGAILERLKALRPGESNRALRRNPDNIPPCVQRQMAQPNGGGATTCYTRIDGDCPAPTITTRFTNVSSGRYGHYEQLRGLSLREGAALQSFPDSYKFYGNGMTANARMIGNALPPRVMAFMANYAISVYEEHKWRK